MGDGLGRSLLSLTILRVLEREERRAASKLRSSRLHPLPGLIQEWRDEDRVPTWAEACRSGW